MPVLSVFGELETFLSEELYPHRYVISAFVLLALLTALAGAAKLGLHHALLRHPIVTALVTVPVVALTLVAGDYLLSPLWERSFLEEKSPVTAIEAAAGADRPEAPAGQGQAALPYTIRMGMFQAQTTSISGAATRC
jgi:hypothetical protein